MAGSRNTAGRWPNVQSTYDFLSGAPLPQDTEAAGDVPPQQHHEDFRNTLRDSRTNVNVKADIGNENLRAQVRSLQYEIDTLKQDREVAKLRNDKALRDAQSRAEDEFQKAQTAENARTTLARKFDSLNREFLELQTNAVNQQVGVEKKLRQAQEQNHTLQEQCDEASSELSSLDRHYKHQLQEVESKHQKLQTTLAGLREDLSRTSSELQASQINLTKRDARVGELEGEILALKNQVGDAADLETVKHEFSEQVEHMRVLERINREQLAELRHLRQVHKAVEIVEEEKRALETRLRAADDMQRELVEAQLRRKMLEDEKMAWTAYLQTSGDDGRSQLEFESPQALAKAFAQERLEKASLVERLGAVQPEISEKEQIIRTLEDERAKMQAEIQKAKSGGSGDMRAKARLERQKALATKEVEYLREQLKTFEAEDMTSDIIDEGNEADVTKEQTTKRLRDLEGLVEQYRSEIQTLNSALAGHEAEASKATSLLQMNPLKRPYDEIWQASDERLSVLGRKNRTLQSDLVTLNKTLSQVQSELSATKSQLLAFQETSRTRVLSLRSNPTDNFQRIKQATLDALQAENKALLSHIEDKASDLVPRASLDSVRLEISELERQVAERDKRMLRLKQIWGQKGLEIREAVASLLGWKMDFMPNGRFRLTSMFNAGTGEDTAATMNGGGGGRKAGATADSGSEENSFIFDGEGGTMKISGGPDSRFAKDVGGLIKFWVDGKREIPGFLAACTLEFYEGRAQMEKEAGREKRKRAD